MTGFPLAVRAGFEADFGANLAYNAGKLVGSNLFIGKRPDAAFGKSPADKQMLEWSRAGDGAHG